MVLWDAAFLADFYVYPPDHPLYRRSRIDIQVPSGSGGVEEERNAAIEYACRRFPRFFEARQVEGGGGGSRSAFESGMEVVLGEGDAIFFPAYWFHYTESLDLSFSLGYRFLELQA
jgi:hypothetical protein